MANKRRSIEELKEIDAVFHRLREFLRLNYPTGAEVARRLGVRDSIVYSWLQGEFKPAHPQRVRSFLDAVPVESSSGIVPERLPISGVQKLAWHSKTQALPILQASKRAHTIRGGHQGVSVGGRIKTGQ